MVFAFTGYVQQIQNIFTGRGRLCGYVGVSFYLFTLYVLNKDMLLLLINNFMFGMCCLPLVIFIFGW